MFVFLGMGDVVKMRISIILVYILMFILFLFSYSMAEYDDYFDDVRYFSKYNPDGIKYAFVKDYLSALSYLKSCFYGSLTDSMEGNNKAPKSVDRIEQGIKKLTQDNLNLRIAKNFISDYRKVNNGLIVKVTDIFIKMCDEQIKLNEEQRHLIEELYKAREKDKPNLFNEREFMEAQIRLSNKRRLVWQDLLKASMLVKKVLISGTPDKYGEFVSLGITETQRRKLLSRLDGFDCKDCGSKIHEGQTFWDASISAIKEILEDTTWDTLPENAVAVR